MLQLKDAKDPDEFLKKFGADRFRHVIGQSKTGFEYKMDTILSKYILENAEDRIKASGELCLLIALFGKRFHFRFVEGRECGFGCGKITGKDNTENNN